MAARVLVFSSVERHGLPEQPALLRSQVLAQLLGLGMAVHDVWNYRQETLKPGVVLALDPQMWIREQEIYIRVEDTVVVTADGVENLTADAPLELDEVETVIQQQGILQTFPPII